MHWLRPFIPTLLTFICITADAQVYHKADSALEQIQTIPIKYITSIDKKIDKYSKRITSKTEKTLTKLSRWEEKIKTMLQKVNPKAAEQLFGSGQLTFTTVLQKIKEGKQVFDNYNTQYNEYRDKLTVNLKYLETQKELLDEKYIKPIEKAKAKAEELNKKAGDDEAMEQFIKERKKQLINTSIQYIGKSKYLTKINKEAWYYAETVKNYKEIFSTPGKAEELAKNILNNIPLFQNFMRQNSMLAGLFDISQSIAQLQPGMQTRNSVQELIQTRIAAMGPSAQQTVSENLQAAHAQLNKLQDNIFKNAVANGGSGYSEMPNFKPNNQKTKTFGQRIDFGFNIQFSQSSNLFPSSSDIALTIAYKLNDRSSAGLGASYKLGMGRIEHIRFTHEGVGFRSFVDWKLKGKFYLMGGAEINHLVSLKEHQQVPPRGGFRGAWQQSALLGIMKKFSGKGKWVKSTNLQLLYDFLAKKHIPSGRQWLFRVGYGF